MLTITKRTTAFLVFFILSIFANAATAAEYDYFSWKLVASFMEVDGVKGLGPYASETINKESANNDVFGLSFAYGHNWQPLRAEIELTFRSDFDYSPGLVFISNPSLGEMRSDLNCHSLFANLYYDVLPKANIVPYVGLGIGISYNVWSVTRWNGYNESEANTGLAWNLSGGLAFKLHRKLLLDLSYRYIDLGEAEIPNLGIDDITSNEIQLGLRLTF